jgi:hypothetical protein
VLLATAPKAEVEAQEADDGGKVIEAKADDIETVKSD